MGSLFLWSHIEGVCLLSSCTLSSSIWLALSGWQKSHSAPSLFWPFLSCLFLGCCLPTAAPVWPDLEKEEAGNLQWPLWPATWGQGYHWQSHVWFPFSDPYWRTPLPVSIFSSLFLHRCFSTLPALSRPFPGASSCLALGKVPFPFSAVQRLNALELSWKLLDSALWSTLSLEGSNPAAAASGPTWNNQAESP